MAKTNITDQEERKKKKKQIKTAFTVQFSLMESLSCLLKKKKKKER